MDFQGITYDIDTLELHDRVDDYCYDACVVSDCGKYIIWGSYCLGEFEPNEIEPCQE